MFSAIAAVPCALPIAIAPASADSGYQVIDGTRVFTQIDHAARVATFSNECGSQQLTQAELQAGAKPDRIIPCPRPGQSSSAQPSLGTFADSCRKLAALHERHGKVQEREIGPHYASLEKWTNGGQWDKLCEFGKTMGIPFFERQIRELTAHRNESCFQPTSQQVLDNTRAILKNYRRTVGEECQKAAQMEGRQAMAGQRPTTASGQQDGGAAKKSVSDTCLTVGQTRMGTPCGGGKNWHWTSVRASKRQGCPKDVEFIYDEDGKTQLPLFTPHNLQTCGPPSQIRAK
jgi:hypothetical protein